MGRYINSNLTDIFSVESEMAKAIADQLRAKLTGEEEQVIAAKPTDNPEAYDAYLRGLAYTLKPGSTANALAAQKYLREAVRLDPKFALSWALLVIHRCALRTESSTASRFLRRSAAGRRNRAHSSAQSRRGRMGQGLLPLRLSKRLRDRGALL